MANQVMIRFECGSEDRVSKEYGPFEFAQLTYNGLRVGPNGEDFAVYDREADVWLPESEPLTWYSDAVIWAVTAA